MTPEGIFIFRPDGLTDKRAIEEARRVIAESLRVLKAHPPPDTFLGSQTHEPVPLPGDEEK
ncbi:hypothetical protein GA0061098_103310 [Bradyrhizobium shewense]|uniref:Uncharacterized protein n=1 Tax=Bradyrhizobium shewense TaxID=1761772 RepID=A0A1C3XRT2_9BRAD|nr:hypothetical protein [Bradyrhizobium shewense]SCB54967.1 hypothetical protein GA0061098_103310 [Bradyrhizobium shewense]